MLFNWLGSNKVQQFQCKIGVESHKSRKPPANPLSNPRQRIG